MSKVIKLLRGLLLLLQKPYLINLILKEETQLKVAFQKQFPDLKLQQIDVFSWPEAQEVVVKPYSFLSGSSLATDFALLQLVCRKYNVQTYFEIGTWRGESAANVAPYVGQVFTLNLTNKQLRQMGADEAYIEAHRTFSQHISNIKHLEGDAANFDLTPYVAACDCIFIDGDHSYEAVKRDTQRMLQLRKNEQSIMIWHDAKSDTEYPRYDVLRGIYEGLPQQMHGHVYLVKHALCAIYLPEGHQSEAQQLHQKPTKVFSLTLKQDAFQG
ncbi:MAG: class I SAM-dependent methyltransferase [Flavobacteriales bacterium]